MWTGGRPMAAGKLGSCSPLTAGGTGIGIGGTGCPAAMMMPLGTPTGTVMGAVTIGPRDTGPALMTGTTGALALGAADTVGLTMPCGAATTELGGWVAFRAGLEAAAASDCSAAAALTA